MTVVMAKAIILAVLGFIMTIAARIGLFAVHLRLNQCVVKPAMCVRLGVAIP